MSRPRDDDASDDGQQRPRKRQNTQDFFRHHHPGFIRSVECINFMCHENLKIDVGPGITFDSGQNGHGKSAILNGLIQVFSTDRKMKGERGTSAALRRNIKDNKKAKSKIIVKINNKEADEDLFFTDEGVKGYTMSPFESETYGDVIIIEREIFEKSRKLKIMTEKKELVSEKTEIMKHFSYQFDNRLTQENAKKRGDPKSLFDFFYNGSGFEGIENDLTAMRREVRQQHECLDSSLLQTTLVKKERRDKLKAECELTAHTKELYDNLQRYKAMNQWLYYSTFQGVLNNALSLEDKCEQLKEVGAKRRAQLEEHKLTGALDAQIAQANRKKTLLKNEKDDINRQLRSSERDVKDLEDQIRLLNHAIVNLRAERDQSNSNAEHKRLDAKIYACEEKVTTAETQLRAFKLKLEEKRNIWKDARSKSQNASSPRTQKEAQLRDARDEASRLEAMSRDKGNPIAGFGHQFVEADRIIQTNMARLRQPPLGPVGQYIKVKPGTSQQELTLINSHQPLTRLLRSYVVATPEDERTLRSILPRNHNPTIYYVKPDNYDVDRISPSSQFKTILRCLDISEARVIQALVEWATVHGTAIAGSTEEAVRALKQGAQNLESAIAPHKTSERFIVTATQRGSQLSSSGVVQSGLLRVGKAIVTGEDVSEAKKRVAVCERELQPLKEEFRRLEQEEQMALREFRSLDEKESVFEQKLQSLKKEHAFAVAERDTIPDAPSTDETDQAIEIKTQELDNSKQQLSETREALEAAKQRSREIANSETEAEVELDKLNAKFLATEEANLRYTAHQDVKFELAKKKLAEKEVELANMETQLAAAQALSEELVPLDEGNGFDYCTKRTGELQAKIDAAKTRNLRDYRIEAEEAYRLAKEEFEAQKKDVRALGDTEADRGQALAFGIMQTSSYFASADVVFDLNTRKLELASTSDASSKGDVATTSGGEHSFLQSALMAALWQMYEVFMDDTTRKNLINTLGGLRQCVQAIFISPTVVKNSAVDDARFTFASRNR
ncbi:LOW QUALITY PROTEIN: hypothetical protein B0I72DRAFT_133065 [Yarrowia lipolytica]|nr:LOW QUALITY PROTEIN: hypothetical protein B0I72DRAFT_133065 [Yarrowia lipolytica]RDW51500.1 LOW QUALITY PROTEIN: hypothetical protein B0I75DRAFT_139765 [Yarrowia lipolytica]